MPFFLLLIHLQAYQIPRTLSYLLFHLPPDTSHFFRRCQLFLSSVFKGHHLHLRSLTTPSPFGRHHLQLHDSPTYVTCDSQWQDVLSFSVMCAISSSVVCSLTQLTIHLIPRPFNLCRCNPNYTPPLRRAPLLLSLGLHNSLIVSMHKSITFEVHQRHVPYPHHCKFKSLLHVNLPNHRTTHRTPRAAFPVEVQLRNRPSTRDVCSCISSCRFIDRDVFLQLS